MVGQARCFYHPSVEFVSFPSRSLPQGPGQNVAMLIDTKKKFFSSGVWCAYAQVVPQGATMGAVESARELGDGFRYIQLCHEVGGGSFRYIQLYHGGGGGRFSYIHYSSMVEGVPW